MEKIFSALIDAAGIIFALLVYTEIMSLKRETRIYKAIMYISCISILALYLTVTLGFNQPSIISSFLFMVLPTLLVFGLISKFKDTRFFVTYFFVASVSLILAFFARIPAIYLGKAGSVIGFVFIVIAATIIFVKTRPFYKSYRDIIENIKDGWVTNMIAMVGFYLLLIFAAAYPEPLADREEYIPIYIALSLSVIMYYIVFAFSLMQKKTLYDLNRELESELNWHKIAFLDALTGMSNRTAYIERINEIPRTFSEDNTFYAVMMDIDGFKKVNDSFGHHVGDKLLIKAAELLEQTFSDPCYETYRIGGDEFAIIAINASHDDLMQRLGALSLSEDGISCEFSYGVAKVHPEENNAMENAFIIADALMYKHKASKK